MSVNVHVYAHRYACFPFLYPACYITNTRYHRLLTSREMCRLRNGDTVIGGVNPYVIIPTALPLLHLSLYNYTRYKSINLGN